MDFLLLYIASSVSAGPGRQFFNFLTFFLTFFRESKEKPHNHAAIRSLFKRRNMHTAKIPTRYLHTLHARINRWFGALCCTLFRTTEYLQNYCKSLRFPYVFSHFLTFFLTFFLKNKKGRSSGL